MAAIPEPLCGLATFITVDNTATAPQLRIIYMPVFNLPNPCNCLEALRILHACILFFPLSVLERPTAVHRVLRGFAGFCGKVLEEDSQLSQGGIPGQKAPRVRSRIILYITEDFQ